MGRIRTAFVSGTILNNPLAIGDVTLSAAGLAALPTIAAPDVGVLCLDPMGSTGNPEIVYVTAHTSTATTATISRAQEGTTARAMVSGTPWTHGATILDFGSPVSTTSPTAYNPLDPWINCKTLPGAAIGGGLSMNTNLALLVPLEPLTSDCTITKLRFKVGVQSGNYDIGVYQFDGTTFTKIVALGSTACPAAGVQDADITDTILYRGIRYYFAIQFDNNTATVTGLTFTFSTVAGYQKAVGSFPLPATITSPAVIGPGFYPEIVAQVSGGIPL